MRSSLTIIVGLLLLLVAALVFGLRGRSDDPRTTPAGSDPKAGAGSPSSLSAESAASLDSRSAVAPEPEVIIPPPAVAQRVEPVAPPPRVAMPPSAPSDFVEPVPDEEEPAQLERFLESKYSGWTSAQKRDAIVKLKESCRAMEEIPGAVKTRAQEYQTLVSELSWLKEHQDS
jgi:hypothetical protein